MDKTGINLTVEDGQHATAGELFEMAMDEMKFPHEAREAFSLWLVSDLLGWYKFRTSIMLHLTLKRKNNALKRSCDIFRVTQSLHGQTPIL